MANRKVETLELLIAKSESIIPVENDSVENSDDDDQDEQREGVISCVSCGKDVSSKLAMRHMETCFNKFELQTSYASYHETKIDGYQMICDFYNPLSGSQYIMGHKCWYGTMVGTYCKRLRVLCPEHTKDPKVGDDEACGYPLTMYGVSSSHTAHCIPIL